ncbi:MAG: type II toxin-antitoxin system RelE/ParE family toxin [Pyrinomonadaceae bacterium]
MLTYKCVAFEVKYYNKRVLTEIESWPVDILADYTRLIELLSEYGPMLGLPHSRSMGSGLFELRPRGKSGIGRAFYCYVANKTIFVVHAFIKKTQQTPDREFKTARKRVKEIKNG